MSLETVTYIEDLVETNPVGATDFVSQGDDHIRAIKKGVKGSLPNLGQNAVTATALELNILDGATLTTAELNFVDGVTSAIQTQLDAKASNAALAALSSVYQPLDADLTAIAALTTTTYGRGFLGLADNAALATKIAAISLSLTGNQTFSPTSGVPLTLNAVAGANARVLDLNVASATSELLVKFSLNSVAKAYEGLIGTAGNLVNGSLQNDFVLRLETCNYLISPDGGATIALKVSSAGVVSVNDAGTLRAAGFRGLPGRTISGSATVAATDAGKRVTYTGSGGHTFTVDATLPDDGIVTVLNDGSGPLTLSFGASQRWFNGSGTVGTGARTLAVGGIATIVNTGSGANQIWGNGLS